MLEIDGRFLRSSRIDRPRVKGVRVIHHEKHPSGGCTDRSGNQALRTLAYAGDPESSLADRQLSDDLFAVAHHMEHAGSEGSLIERDRRHPLVDPQLGLYGRHDLGVFTLNQRDGGLDRTATARTAAKSDAIAPTSGITGRSASPAGVQGGSTFRRS
jgi:hypothetical protein